MKSKYTMRIPAHSPLPLYDFQEIDLFYRKSCCETCTFPTFLPLSPSKLPREKTQNSQRPTTTTRIIMKLRILISAHTWFQSYNFKPRELLLHKEHRVPCQDSNQVPNNSCQHTPSQSSPNLSGDSISSQPFEKPLKM